MLCWYCKTAVPLSVNGTLSFRALCDTCGRDLHCCKNCAHHRPGRANDCAVPGTEWVADREKNCFCEEFSPANEKSATPSRDAQQRFENLFK